MEIDEDIIRSMVAFASAHSENRKKRAAQRFENLKKAALMLREGRSLSEISNICRLDKGDIGELRRRLNIVAMCQCGRPATHTERCEFRMKRLTAMDPEASACESGFASARCENFLSKRPELQQAVAYFREHGHEDYPDVDEPLIKLSRFGSMTENQVAAVLRAHQVATRRRDEQQRGEISRHVGIIGQRMLRMMVQLAGTQRVGYRQFRVEALDERRNVVVWFTETPRDYPDGWFPIDCNIKEHVHQDGRDETVLACCIVQPMEVEKGPFEEIVAELEPIESQLDEDATERLRLARAALGDMSAFDALAISLRGQMFQTAAANVGISDADDVVQIALIDTWNYAPRFRFRVPVWAWFVTITRRAALNEFRARCRRRELSLEAKMEESEEHGAKWEPVANDLPPYGGLLIKEATVEREALLA